MGFFEKRKLRRLQLDVRQKLLSIPPEDLQSFDLCAYQRQLVEEYNISPELSRKVVTHSGFLNHKACLMYLNLLPVMTEHDMDVFVKMDVDNDFVTHIASSYHMEQIHAYMIMQCTVYIISGYKMECLLRKKEEMDHPGLADDPAWKARPEEEARIVHDFVANALADGTLHPICNWGSRSDKQSGSADRIAKMLNVSFGYAFFLIQTDLDTRGMSIVPTAPCPDPPLDW